VLGRISELKQTETKWKTEMIQNWDRNSTCIRWCNQTFPNSVDKEIYVYKNKHSLRSKTKGYGDKIH
jgi:hypothetical protein